MRFENWIAAALCATFVILSSGIASAADRNRFFDSGQPRELINRPACSSAEMADEYSCDFAQRT